MKKYQSKLGFVLADAMVGLMLIGLGTVTYGQAHMVMTHQLAVKKVAVEKWRQAYEKSQANDKNSTPKEGIHAH